MAQHGQSETNESHDTLERTSKMMARESGLFRDPAEEKPRWRRYSGDGRLWDDL